MATPTRFDLPSYHFDDVVVDCANFRIHKSGQVRTLTPRAFDLLVYLIEHRNRVIEKQELFEQVWKESFVTDNALTRAIKDIRRAIGDDADAPRYIETVPKRGYRFIAEVGKAEETKPETSGAEERPAEQVLTQSEPRSDTEAEAAIASPNVGVTKAGSKLRYKPLVAAIALILIAVVVFAIWNVRDKPAQPQPTRAIKTTQVTAWPGLDIHPSLSPDGNAIAYSSDHDGSFEIYVKPITPGAREIQLTSDGQQNFQPAWSPDGKLIAYYSKGRGGIWVVPASGGLARQLTDFGARPAWSPDGSLVAFQSEPQQDLGANANNAMPPSTLWAVPAQGGNPAPITQVGNPLGGHGSPSWSPDGKRIVFSASDYASYSVWMVSVNGGELKRLAAGADPIYSPDGEAIYYVLKYELWRISVSLDGGDPMGEPVKVADAGATSMRYMTISADGKKMAYCALASASNLWSVPISPNSGEAVGVPVPLAPNTSFRNTRPNFSPDGRRIAFGSWRTTTIADIWVMDSDGKNPVQITTDVNGSCLSWFPEGDRIGFFSSSWIQASVPSAVKGLGPANLWAIAVESGRKEPLLDLGEEVDFVELSPDGKDVAFNSKRGGTINIWRIPIGGGEVKQLTFDKELAGFPYWSRDGKFLAFEIQRGDDTHIAVMPSEGGEITQLTFDRGQSWPGAWSPDGDKIAFAGSRNGYWNVWWVSRNNRTQKQVTNYRKLNAYVRYPAWSPLENQIVFEYAETTGNIWLMELK